MKPENNDEPSQNRQKTTVLSSPPLEGSLPTIPPMSAAVRGGGTDRRASGRIVLRGKPNNSATTTGRQSPLLPDRLPENLQHNPQHQTLSIFYHDSHNNTTTTPELFTEIPFLAIHGMQTHGDDEDDCHAWEAALEWSNSLLVAASPTQQESSPFQKNDENVDDKTPNLTRPLLLATLVTSGLQFLAGYNMTVLNSLSDIIFPGHSTWAWSACVAAFAMGAPFGSYGGGQVASRHGRKYALGLTMLVYAFSGMMQCMAPSLMYICVGRWGTGLACGMATTLVPIYLGELAPPTLRGSIGTINQFAYVFGIWIADILSFVWANDNGWRYLLGLTLLINLLQLAMFPWVLESPRWILALEDNKNKNNKNKNNSNDNNNDLDKTAWLEQERHERAKATLQQLRGYSNPQDLQREFDTYTRASQAHGNERETSQWELLQQVWLSDYRYLMICVLALHALKQLSGVSMVFYYSTKLFDGLMENPMIITTVIGSTNVLFTYVAILLMDSCRRKSLLLWSYGGMFMACTTLLLSQLQVFPGGDQLNTISSLLAVNVYVAFFEIGIGPIVWIVVAELFEARHVTCMMIVCSQCGWLVNFGVSLVFPSMSQALGSYAFAPFCGTLVLGYIFIKVCLPESHGRSANQILVDVQVKSQRLVSSINAGTCGALGSTSSSYNNNNEDWKNHVLA